MSRCGKTEQLEALVMGELAGPRVAELQLHTTRCAACHHELHWLESERLMFEHRLAREQVDKLWEGFAARRAAPAAQLRRRWERVALAVAASAVLVLGLSARNSTRPSLQGELFDSSAPMSLEEMSRDLGGGLEQRDCSQLPPGQGFACGPFLPASFALRE